MNKPKNANELMIVVNNNIDKFVDRSSPIQPKPATEKMIRSNIRYIDKYSNNGGYLEKIWKTPEGQESILYAFNESLEHAASLPEMGSIVPFGKTAEFIPSVECYNFTLTTGNNAPFQDTNIVPIHTNDQTKVNQTDGNFNIDIDYGIPRGDIVAVCVYATRKDTGKRIGEVYDVARLLEKAARHSTSYKYYLKDMAELAKAKSEGKDFIIDRWNNKKYERDITTPYVGPDQVEMLKKTAGKSFFRPYMKIRNSMAMADEWTETDIDTEMDFDQTVSQTLNKAAGQFDNIPEAEIVPEPEEKKDLKNKEKNETNNEDIPDM